MGPRVERRDECGLREHFSVENCYYATETKPGLEIRGYTASAFHAAHVARGDRVHMHMHMYMCMSCACACGLPAG